MIGEPFPKLCASDRAFAQHVARVCANDLPWEHELPAADLLITRDGEAWGRRNREQLDIWRNCSGKDWVKTGYG